MTRFKIAIEYFGKNYSGWQRQKNALSVQEVLEEKLKTALQQDITLFGSGRTDGGVHAVAQVAHFDADTKIPPEKLLFAVNTMLPNDIRITSCEEAAPDFHAQYSAKRKTYIYKAYISKIIKPLKFDFYERVLPPADIEKMRRAAALLVGVHDFKAFSSAHSTAKSSVREIYKLDIIITDGGDLVFEIEGNGFLFNMVRIIVGTLVYIGKGRIPPENVEKMLKTGDRKLGGKTFPAKGLYLKEVFY